MSNEPMYPGASDQGHELKGPAIDVEGYPNPRFRLTGFDYAAAEMRADEARAAAEAFKAAYPELMKLIHATPLTEEQRVAIDKHGAEVVEIGKGVFEVWCASHATHLIATNRAYLDKRARDHNANWHPNLPSPERKTD